LQTEEAGYRSWVISNEKGQEVVRLSNVTLSIRDEVLMLDGYANPGGGKPFEAQRWAVTFDKAHAK
jgi:hypothetical protein